MATVRPTLSEIYTRMRADASSALPGTDVELPRTLFGVQLVAFVGAIHEAWGHLDSIATDVFPDVATQGALERWAAIWGLFRVQAVTASGTVNLGVLVTAPPLEPGRTMRRADGAEFVTTAVPVLQAGGHWLANVAAVLAGAGGNYTGTVQLVEPVPGLTDLALTTTAGADGDTDEELRARLLDLIRKPPQGGTADDFERWALEVPGLTRAWAQTPAAGSPAFTVYVADDANLPPTASGADVIAAQAVTDLNKPITSDPTVTAATFHNLDASITVLPATGAMQAAVDAEIVSMLLERATPGGTILLAWLLEAVAGTPGLVNFTITDPITDEQPAGAAVVTKGTTVYS